MSGAKAEVVRGNPVIPKASIPKKVLDSNATSPPSKEMPKADSSSALLDRPERVYPNEDAIGTITISIFKGKPYEVKFDGKIAGFELNTAVSAIRKQYKLWKRSLIKREGK